MNPITNNALAKIGSAAGKGTGVTTSQVRSAPDVAVLGPQQSV